MYSLIGYKKCMISLKKETLPSAPSVYFFSPLHCMHLVMTSIFALTLEEAYEGGQIMGIYASRELVEKAAQSYLAAHPVIGRFAWKKLTDRENTWQSSCTYLTYCDYELGVSWWECKI